MISFFSSCSNTLGKLFFYTGNKIDKSELRNNTLSKKDCEYLLDGSDEATPTKTLSIEMAKSGVITGGIIDGGILIYLAYLGIQLNYNILSFVSIFSLPWTLYSAELEYNKYESKSKNNNTLAYLPESGKILIEGKICNPQGIELNFGRKRYSQLPSIFEQKNGLENNRECEKKFLQETRRIYNKNFKPTKPENILDFCFYNVKNYESENSIHDISCICTIFWPNP